MEAIEQEIRLQAANFLYAFMDDSEITSQLMGRYRNIVLQKKYAQLRYLKGTAVATQHDMDEVVGWVKSAISDVYQEQKSPTTGRYVSATPRNILYHLAEGRPAGGKDWNIGRVGELPAIELTTPQIKDYFNQNNLSFNKYTGNLTSGGATVASSPGYYAGQLFSKTFDLGDNGRLAAVAANRNPTTGEYNIAAISDAWKKIGQTEKAQKALNVLQTIALVVPYVCNTIVSLRQWLTKDDVDNSSQIAPNQKIDGWFDASQQKQQSTASVAPWILASVALGAIVITSKDKKAFRTKR